MQTHDEKVIRIDLTVDQQQQLKAAIGKDAQAIELTLRELEQRIVPRIAVNHNETMLDEHFG